MNLMNSFRSICFRAAWRAWIVAVASPAVGSARDYVFTLITTTEIPIPGGSETFTALGIPSLGGGRVAFRGQGSGSQRGIYLWEEGTVLRVADVKTAVPEGEGTFYDFFEGVSLAENGTIAFIARVGNDPSGEVPQLGIYTDRDGPLSVLLAPGTVLPGNDHPMDVPRHISYDGVEVAFHAATRVPGELPAEGIYKSDGTAVVLVADEHTLHPDRGIPFTFGVGRGHVALSGGNVVFTAAGDRPSGTDPEGVFALIGGRLQVIADVGTLASFQGVSMSGGVITFGNIFGIYRWTNDELETIVDMKSIIPGRGLTFNRFGSPSVGANGVGFVAGHWMSRFPIERWRFTLDESVYVQDASGTLSQVIGWPFPEQQVKPRVDFDSGPEGISGDSFAFRVTRGTGWQGIFVATPAAP